MALERNPIFQSFREAHKGRPSQPYSQILNKPASQLTETEVQTLPAAKLSYETAMKHYQAELATHEAAVKAWWEKLRRDLAEHYAIIGHPKEPMLWEMCYQGPQDIEETLDDYDRLVDLLIVDDIELTKRWIEQLPL